MFCKFVLCNPARAGQGTNRNQDVLFAGNLEYMISPDNEVRLIDVVAESIKIEDFGCHRKK